MSVCAGNLPNCGEETPTRTLLVDDNAVFLEAASRFLALQPQVELVGKASSGLEALALVATLEPQLVLLDWSMPEMSGLEVTRTLKSQAHAPQIVIVTEYSGPHYQEQAALAGADGFVSKEGFVTELLPLMEGLLANHAGRSFVTLK